jgi:arylsulfatase A-like enzyme
MKVKILSILLLVLTLISGRSPQKTPPTRPNVVFILADDLGYGDLGCFGQKVIATPHIDHLATEGVRLTQHYAGSTVCAPSRCALMTGKHVGHGSIRGNQPVGQLIRPEETTLAEVFKQAGYATGIIGKWGMGNKPANDDALKNGFDYHFGFVDMWHAHTFFSEFLYRNGEKYFLEGNKTEMTPDAQKVFGEKRPIPDDICLGIGVQKTKYVPYEFDREVSEFLEKNKSQPFFLMLTVNTPHANSEFKKDGMEVTNFGEFEGKDWKNPEKGFAKMIRDLDNSVGKITDQLKALGLDDNTIVIFTSDNGPHQEGGHSPDYFDSNGLLRGTKRDMYEGGIRVPTIVRWKNTLKANTTSAHISAFWDWLPTFCDLTGSPKPAQIDGISLLPTLMGKPKNQAQHKYLYWEFYELGGRQAVRWGDWKGVKLNVEDPKNTVFELYNLKNDISETKNVAAKNPAVVKQIERMMREAHQPFALADLFKKTGTKATGF